MEIQSIDLTKLRNAEHSQFHTEFKEQLELKTALSLGVVPQFADYTQKYTDESEAMVYISKSSYTEQLAAADDRRDMIFRGLADTIFAAQNHYKDENIAAAKKLAIILNTYGNIANESYDEETALISKFVEELQGNYLTETELLGLAEWAEELKKSNTVFQTLKDQRYSEESGKTELRMKNVRKQTDEVYKSIINRINAQILLNGEANYKDFVTALNLRIEHYKTLIVQHKKRASASSATNASAFRQAQRPNEKDTDHVEV